ncbi:hypothetical protein CVT24_008395 [Panaeolus cyanescens]|uniref:Uncharacterized protein n=1 Tax=Panaeolus cyanescens TaxID=181874 RepID=A0A409VL34_9AGAR|nr:hypothetical protein CVT24_008395 [Panaeolus cyanescens]
MKFALAFLLAPLAVVAIALDNRADEEPAVFTVEQVFATIIDKAPFMVETTQTVVWTQSPSVAPAQPTADAPLPTLDPAYNAAD